MDESVSRSTNRVVFLSRECPLLAEQFTVYLNATSAIPGPNGQQLPVATA